jgi:hypothetical protein
MAPTMKSKGNVKTKFINQQITIRWSFTEQINDD